MGYQRSYNNRDDRGSSRYGSSGRNDDFKKREFFDAICDECGKDCKVPFRPTGDKPIYCSECFEKVDQNRDGRDSRDRAPRRDFGRDRDNRAPRRDFDRDNAKPANNNSEIYLIRDQLVSVNAKLEKLLEILTPSEPKRIIRLKDVEKTEKVEKVEKEVKAKTVKKAKPKKKVSQK